MKTVIYYFTGTGNSLWTARRLAAEIGGADLVPMAGFNGGGTESNYESVGFVFPVHMWGVPRLVIDFLKKLDTNPGVYYFAAAVNAGQVSRTLIQLRNLMKSYGSTLSAGIDVVLPSNYIPWGGPGPAETVRRRIDEAGETLRCRAAAIAKRESAPVDRGPLWQRIVFTALYRLTFPRISAMDKGFLADDKCNSCGICARVCPVGNVAIREGRPAWGGGCVQCLSCIQWCPKAAIQYGKKTSAYERYHHPEVRLVDIIRAAE
ncbi:MAG: 4Fe-4S ferredoxin [Spirochaetes bacterium]|nr:MAG: 4Fe-4S ferredoxin [Spirochaetota bacterium]